MGSVDTLRALAVATNSLRYNPEIEPDIAAAYERFLVNLRDELCKECEQEPNPPLTLDRRMCYCPVCDPDYPGCCDTCFYSSRREELEPCKSCVKAFQDSEGEESPGYKPANYCFNCGRPITEYAKMAYRRKPEGLI